MPMAYDDYLEKMSKYFSTLYSQPVFSLLETTDFFYLFMTIGLVNGVIMSRCRLLQTWYIFLLLCVIPILLISFTWVVRAHQQIMISILDLFL